MKPVDGKHRERGFSEDGFLFPLDAMTSAQAAIYRDEFESLEDSLQASIGARRGQLSQVHLVLRFVSEITRNERILNAVESLIGPNILVWGSTFIIKEPHSEGYVSWHQDLRYWGLEDPRAMVSAWLALGPVNKANGCMQFVRRSHLAGLLEHKDIFSENNFLYRGQEAQVEIDKSEVLHVELEPGQFSLHHGHLLHASPANRSSIRRCGLVINYIAPHNRQVIAERDFAMLVRGEDKCGYFDPTPDPEFDLSAESLELRSRVLAVQDQAAYAGAEA